MKAAIAALEERKVGLKAHRNDQERLRANYQQSVDNCKGEVAKIQEEIDHIDALIRTACEMTMDEAVTKVRGKKK